jgi:hypothetical protein
LRAGKICEKLCGDLLAIHLRKCMMGKMETLSHRRVMESPNLRFGPPIRFNPLGELKGLHRTGTIEEYQRQFLPLLCRCDGLTPEHKMNLFMVGLVEPMCSNIEMQRPADLQATMSLVGPLRAGPQLR